MHTPTEWIRVIVFGGLLGAIGQLIRAIAGLKKLSDDVSQKNLTLSDCFSPSQLVISVVIGAVAGILGAVSLGVDPNKGIGAAELTPLLGIGYAGSDFIEAFMKTQGAAIASPGRTANPVAATRASAMPGRDSVAVG